MITQGDTLLRTPETYAKYHNNPKREAKECFICAAPVVESFWFWNLIANDFPYDAVASKHMMLVPKRHIASGEGLFGAERLELDSIKHTFDALDTFDAALENFRTGRTFLPHYHLHLIKWKRK